MVAVLLHGKGTAFPKGPCRPLQMPGREWLLGIHVCVGVCSIHDLHPGTFVPSAECAMYQESDGDGLDVSTRALQGS